MNDRQRLEAIVTVVCKYLPPDGISREQAMTEIIGLIDPLPPQRTEQEPVAWRTFDGEGGYDYRSHEDNESYADEWNKRNPNHKGWVDKLYTHPQRTWVDLADEEIQVVAKQARSKDHAVTLTNKLLREKNT